MRRDDQPTLAPAGTPIIDAGVDWLTVTSLKTHEGHERDLTNWYEILNRRRHDAGVYEEASVLGYAGLKTEHLFVGTRWDGAMLRMSGSYARETWNAVSVSNGNVTRLDLQVTVQWNGEGAHPARLAAIGAEMANEQLPVSRQRLVHEHKDNRQGYTTYIGSRQSAAFARVYHKSAQAPDEYPENTYRYEVQFNKETAPMVHKSLLENQDRAEAYVIAVVWDWFERRGVIPVFRRSGEVVNIPREVLPLTDMDKKLRWLYNQVRPTVTDLLSLGHREAVLVALLGTELGKEVETSIVAVELERMVPALSYDHKNPAFEYPISLPDAVSTRNGTPEATEPGNVSASE